MYHNLSKIMEKTDMILFAFLWLPVCNTEFHFDQKINTMKISASAK